MLVSSCQILALQSPTVRNRSVCFLCCEIERIGPWCASPSLPRIMFELNSLPCIGCAPPCTLGFLSGRRMPCSVPIIMRLVPSDDTSKQDALSSSDASTSVVLGFPEPFFIKMLYSNSLKSTFLDRNMCFSFSLIFFSHVIKRPSVEAEYYSDPALECTKRAE